MAKSIDEWNKHHSVGGRVIVTLDSGEQLRTFTRSAAFVNPHGTPVIFVDGIRGYYLLDRVESVGDQSPNAVA